MEKISNNGERKGVGAVYGGNKDAVMVGVAVRRVYLLHETTTMHAGFGQEKHMFYLANCQIFTPHIQVIFQ